MVKQPYLLSYLKKFETLSLGECLFLEKQDKKVKGFQGGVNNHPHSAWLEFPAKGRKSKSTSVREWLQLLPGAEHPV